MMLLNIYFTISFLTCFVVGVCTISGEEPEGVNNFWDGIAYGFLWPLQLIKSIFKIIFK